MGTKVDQCTSDYSYPISKIKANTLAGADLPGQAYAGIFSTCINRQEEQEAYSLGQGTYSCQDFRTEMVILGLRRRLQNPALSKEEREQILSRLRELEAEAGMD